MGKDGEETVRALSREVEMHLVLPFLSSSFLASKSWHVPWVVPPCSSQLFLFCNFSTLLYCYPLPSSFSKKRTRMQAFSPPLYQTLPVAAVVVASFLAFVVDATVPNAFVACLIHT